MQLAPRSERRAAWSLQCRVVRLAGLPEPVWEGFAPSPLQAHALAKRSVAGGNQTMLVAAGLNRAQRRAFKARKGSRRMVEHSRGTAGVESFYRTRGTALWNKFAVRLEARSRVERMVQAHAERNRWHRRALRLLRNLPWLARTSWRFLWYNLRLRLERALGRFQ